MKTYEKEPLKIVTPVPNGNYEVTLNLKASSDTVYSVFSQHRRFIEIDREIKNGEEHTITFIANVCDHIDKHGELHPEELTAAIVCDGDITVTSMVSPIEVPTLYILGDSTVTDQPSEYPYEPESTYCGWGQVITMLLNNEIAVSNHAESGSTTQDAYDEHFKSFRDKIKPGDYLMIEFGHNDQKRDYLDAYGGYAKNLRYFVNYAKEKGAKPILNSPINRIIFDEDGKIFNLLGEYRDAVKSVADETGVPFLDMWTATTEFFEPLGLYTAKRYFRHLGDEQDYTHSNDLGGSIIGRIAAGLIADAKIEGLSDKVKTGLIKVQKPVVPPDAPFLTNAHEFKRLKSIGIGSVPADMDADIENI